MTISIHPINYVDDVIDATIRIPGAIRDYMRTDHEIIGQRIKATVRITAAGVVLAVLIALDVAKLMYQAGYALGQSVHKLNHDLTLFLCGWGFGLPPIQPLAPQVNPWQLQLPILSNVVQSYVSGSISTTGTAPDMVKNPSSSMSMTPPCDMVDQNINDLMSKPLPSQQVLRELFNYDLETGVFTYKVKPNFRIKIGSVAGTIKSQGRCKGYCFIKVNGELYQASRLAWMYVYGEDPGKLTVDHIDRNPSNNAIWNLRLATMSEQAFNKKTINKLARGIWFNKKTGKYIARFNFRKAGYTTSKSFETLEDAIKYSNEMRKQHGKDFAVIDN